MHTLHRLVRLLRPGPPKGQYDNDGFPREHPRTRDSSTPRDPGAGDGGGEG